jgi:hypothetical protein
VPYTTPLLLGSPDAATWLITPKLALPSAAHTRSVVRLLICASMSDCFLVDRARLRKDAERASLGRPDRLEVPPIQRHDQVSPEPVREYGDRRVHRPEREIRASSGGRHPPEVRLR